MRGALAVSIQELRATSLSAGNRNTASSTTTSTTSKTLRRTRLPKRLLHRRGGSGGRPQRDSRRRAGEAEATVRATDCPRGDFLRALWAADERHALPQNVQLAVPSEATERTEVRPKCTVCAGMPLRTS